MRELSRREAIAAGLAAAAALAPARVAAAAEPDPGPALTALARAEEAAVFIYGRARLAALGARMAGKDGEHAKALATHLGALGLEVPGPTASRDELGPAGRAVLDANGDAERRQAAIAFEQALIDGCAGRLAALDDPGMVRTVATIMAGHAQHQLLLRGVL